jgi:hypothetical protein
MKKALAFLFCLFFYADCSFGQAVQQESLTKPWKFSGIFTWSYNQTDISKNWTGKETYSRAWHGRLDTSAVRDSQSSNWLNTLKEYYGETVSNGSSSISLDTIEFNSVYTYKIFKNLQPYGSFYILSQNNKFWDPVTYIESAGLNFTLINSSMNTLKVRAGAAFKQIFNSKKDVERDFGGESVIDYIFVFRQNTKFTSQFRIFETFRPTCEDIYWENRLFLKTGPWLTTEIGYIVYFDHSRIESHSWTNDVERMFYIALGFSFNMFQK